MKKARIATVLLVGIMLIPLLALAGFTAMEPAVDASYDRPWNYTGHAYLSSDDSIPVPDGTPIRAIQDSIPLAETITGLLWGHDDNEFYFVVIAVWETEVNFEIWMGDWLPAEETAIHGGFTAVYVDLHAGVGAPDPTPTPTPTSTPRSTPTPTPTTTPTLTPTPTTMPAPTPTPMSTPTPPAGYGPCFIATAAYGTESAVEIDTLRAFRDEVLLKNSLGSQFVDFYYEVSPPVADLISENDVLRTLVREFLVDPVASVIEATESLWRN